LEKRERKEEGGGIEEELREQNLML